MAAVVGSPAVLADGEDIPRSKIRNVHPVLTNPPGLLLTNHPGLYKISGLKTRV
jgi:hypothetical protein